MHKHKATTNIILSNVVVFILFAWIYYLLKNSPQSIYYFYTLTNLSYNGTISEYYIWTLISYGFIHSGVSHIFWNMIILFFVGSIAESILGSKRFVKFYFAAIVVSGIGFLIGTSSPYVLCVGASGAINAVFCFAALSRRNMIIYLFGMIRMRFLTLFMIFFVIDLITLLSPDSGGVAVFCHLGGTLFGYLFYKYENRTIVYDNHEDNSSDIEL